MQEYLIKLNDDIKEFFERYIEFLKSYIYTHKIFAPLISEYLYSENHFLTNNEVAAVS